MMGFSGVDSGEKACGTSEIGSPSREVIPILNAPDTAEYPEGRAGTDGVSGARSVTVRCAPALETSFAVSHASTPADELTWVVAPNATPPSGASALAGPTTTIPTLIAVIAATKPLTDLFTVNPQTRVGSGSSFA
jgi:hypothetical protein